MGRTTMEVPIRTKNIDEILHIIASIVESNRSEERRVGKECM